MYRWSKCPGSVSLCSTVPPAVESAYAAEGTKAHELASGLLMGRSVELPDPDMAEAVAEYVNLCKKYIETKNAVAYIERKFDLSKVYPGCFGTADFVCYWPQHKKLIVIDFKYGSGIWIDPKDNPQLLYYGLGAVLDLNLPDVETVELGICQPRCGDGAYRCVEVSVMDLLDFRTELIEYAKATEVPDAQLTPGEHCRFCPASGVCPALQSRANDVAKMEFAVSPSSYDPTQLAQALAMRDYAELSAGREIPGWKLVEKRATRKWNDEKAVADLLEDFGDQAYAPRELKSPAQMEKTDKKMYAVVADNVVKESSGCTVVPESDKRPAVKQITAQQDFAEEAIDVFS
jgi:hypothetical protein